MSIKRFQTRICNKIDTISALTPQSGALVPLAGEIVIGKQSANSQNTDSLPYIMKIGDGTRSWENLPAIGPMTFYGLAPTSSNPAGAGNQVISVSIPKDRKIYSVYHFADGGNDPDDTQFTLAVTGGDYMLTEHYIMLDNSNSVYDRLFDGITIAGINSANIYCQKEWVSAYDLLEVKIAIYKINDTLCATVTAKTGFTNGGNL